MKRGGAGDKTKDKKGKTKKGTRFGMQLGLEEKGSGVPNVPNRILVVFVAELKLYRSGLAKGRFPKLLEVLEERDATAGGGVRTHAAWS